MAPLFVFLTPGSLNNTANIIKGFAIAIGIAIAIGFVWLWWTHRQRERRFELASRARSSYAAHLKVALQHPELSDPMLGGLNSPVEIARYKHFVASLLVTAEEILAFEPAPAWQETLIRQLAPHRSYLASDDFRMSTMADCSPSLQALLQQVTGSASVG